ncbi:MAG: TIGR00282 family metallophosphoesterase [Calditrichaeota bacterium]|nr:TIGR00282 family metallophosphoesterase [Calditrichota bacterium]RQW02756.1 MAG: TIGR00282 family metallophosphoesterase [Calditrichota bacterium]
MKILFIADIVGEEVVDIIFDVLPRLKRRHGIDFIIANAENLDKGKGIQSKQVERLKAEGIDCLTSGNHIWEPRKKEVLVTNAGYLLRPLNYPEGNLGVGSTVLRTADGLKVGIINAQGRSFMYPINCPFNTVMKEVRRIRSETPVIVVDFHAEATAEKQALAWYLDGKVSAVIGTHTHVQTADERILNNGTAYITDAGMTGPFDSVIGMDTQKAIDRFMLQTHIYYSIAKENLRFNGIILTIDPNTGKAENIERLNFSKKEFDKSGKDN